MDFGHCNRDGPIFSLRSYLIMDITTKKLVKDLESIAMQVMSLGASCRCLKAIKLTAVS